MGRETPIAASARSAHCLVCIDWERTAVRASTVSTPSLVATGSRETMSQKARTKTQRAAEQAHTNSYGTHELNPGSSEEQSKTRES